MSYWAVVAFSCLLEVYGASLIAQLVKNLPCGRPWFNSWVGKIHWRWDRLPNPSILGLPLWLNWSRIHLQWGRHGFDPWIGKIPWRRGRLPTPVFSPGEFSPRGCKELDMTERFSFPLWRFNLLLVRIKGRGLGQGAEGKDSFLHH